MRKVGILIVFGFVLAMAGCKTGGDSKCSETKCGDSKCGDSMKDSSTKAADKDSALHEQDGVYEAKPTGDKNGSGSSTLDVKCPVSGTAAVMESSVDHNGKTVYFCCDKCKGKFEKEPAKFVKY